MFCAAWSWIVPLVGAGAVFCSVLLTTPPGFKAITDVVVGSPRGPGADAGAYALGAAATLALVALIGLAAACLGLELAVRRLR
jgi:hypothetical protein